MSQAFQSYFNQNQPALTNINSILKVLSPLCTGVILSAKVVLTSASCFFKAQGLLPQLSNMQVISYFNMQYILYFSYVFSNTYYNLYFLYQVIAGATNFKDPDNQISHVKDTRYPISYEVNPVVFDLVILILDVGFKLDGCKISKIRLPEITQTQTHGTFSFLISTIDRIIPICSIHWII